MKGYSLVVACCLFSTTAFAGNHHHGNTTSASAVAHSSSAASGGSSTAFGGTGGAGGSGGNGQVDVSDHTRTVIAPALGGLVGTACMGSSQVSAGALTFGVGIGTTWHDDECTTRENIKLVSQFNSALAYEMTADLKGVKEAAARLAKNPPPAPTVVEKPVFVYPPLYSPCEHPDQVSADVYLRYCE